MSHTAKLRAAYNTTQMAQQLWQEAAHAFISRNLTEFHHITHKYNRDFLKFIKGI